MSKKQDQNASFMVRFNQQILKKMEMLTYNGEEKLVIFKEGTNNTSPILTMP